jgi:hypothetical protein
MNQRSAAVVLLCVSVGCSDEGTRQSTVTLHTLRDTERGFLREISRQSGPAEGPMGEPERPPDEGGMIVPEPGGECPFFEYREEHTVVVDAEGNIVSETWSFCSRCVDAEGATIGEEVCYEEPILPPEVVCREWDDGMAYCYECVDSTGTVVDAACYPKEEPPPPDPGCCDSDVCAFDPYCCDVEWDRLCELEREQLCGGRPDDPTIPEDGGMSEPDGRDGTMSR